MIEFPSLETLRLFKFWIKGEDPYATVTVHKRLWPKPKLKLKRKIRVVKPGKVRNAHPKSTSQKRQTQQGQPQLQNHRAAS
jgi:hypothetical protein